MMSTRNTARSPCSGASSSSDSRILSRCTGASSWLVRRPAARRRDSEPAQTRRRAPDSAPADPATAPRTRASRCAAVRPADSPRSPLRAGTSCTRRDLRCERARSRDWPARRECVRAAAALSAAGAGSKRYTSSIAHDAARGPAGARYSSGRLSKYKRRRAATAPYRDPRPRPRPRPGCRARTSQSRSARDRLRESRPSRSAAGRAR